MLEYRINCGHGQEDGWCNYCTQLWKEAYEKGINDTGRTITGYMCKTDYYHELGSSSNASQIFSSVESLKKNKECWKDCGILEVEISIKKIIH